MIRLTFSHDRGELATLENKLSRAGILSEVRSNPLTSLLGISRFEIFVHDADLAVASEVCQGYALSRVETDPPGEVYGRRGFDGQDDPAQSELLIEAKVVSGSAAEPAPDRLPDEKTETGGANNGNELAQATALLEEEVEALLAREGKLIHRCATLEEKVKSSEKALALAQVELARESSQLAEAERKLTEAGETRASLEKEVHGLELRLKTAEQALATAQARLDSQAQRQEELTKERREQQAQVQAYVGTVNELRSRVRARLAAKEDEGSTTPERRTRRASVEK